MNSIAGIGAGTFLSLLLLMSFAGSGSDEPKPTVTETSVKPDSSGSVSFPGASWKTVKPQDIGWSLPKLEEARKFYETLPPASVMVIDHGQVAVSWGDPAKRIKISSCARAS